jgi:hypothetical protein
MAPQIGNVGMAIIRDVLKEQYGKLATTTSTSLLGLRIKCKSRSYFDLFPCVHIVYEVTLPNHTFIYSGQAGSKKK